jgi:hypothetical protein
MVKSFFLVLVAFVSVWREKHPEKMCVILNIFETRILHKGRPTLRISKVAKTYSSSPLLQVYNSSFIRLE